LGFGRSSWDLQLVTGVQPAQLVAEDSKHISRGTSSLRVACARTCATWAARTCLSVATAGGVATRTSIGRLRRALGPDMCLRVMSHATRRSKRPSSEGQLRRCSAR
jgi:hypothetical protein